MMCATRRELLQMRSAIAHETKYMAEAYAQLSDCCEDAGRSDLAEMLRAFAVVHCGWREYIWEGGQEPTREMAERAESAALACGMTLHVTGKKKNFVHATWRHDVVATTFHALDIDTAE